MIFRKADQSEAEEIMSLYRAVTGMPYCTWNASYPGEAEITGDLSSGTLYVLEDEGALIGAVSIVPDNEMDGLACWKVRENAREFARVVVRPDHQQKGLSAALIEGIIQVLRRQHAAAVHIAVAKVNIPAQKLYQRMAFEFRGEADMYGNSFFLCERIL